MDHHTENTSTFIAKPAHSLVWKQRPAICRSPAPQTSLIFQLPDELILFILSYIFPEPRLAGSYARYCVQYCMEINSDHQRRMESSLQPLSMACRTMRLRLLPWIWDLIQPSRRFGIYLVLWNFNATTRAVHVNRSLATFVRFMTVHYLRDEVVHPFVRCLSSLPNLHTLKLGSYGDGPDTTLLKTALGRTRLPRIRTLIIPEPAHPLLEHCPDVEDVVWVIADKPINSDRFLLSLTSNCDSKVERLTIPLILPCNPSRYVAACSWLTELTVLYPHPCQHPHPRDTLTEMGTLVDTVGTVRSALQELVNACNALPNFHTFQIVHLSLTTTPPTRKCWRCRARPHAQSQTLRKQIQDMKDWAINCFTGPEMGFQEGGGRQRATLRFIELSSVLADTPSPDVDIPPMFHLHSVKVEEYGV